MTAIVETRNLTHRYGKHIALHELSLCVEAGTIVGLIGPQGAGKSTAMRLLATLLRPAAGDAHVGGCSVRQDPRGVRRQVGYVPDGFGVYGRIKVWEYLDFYLACYGVPRHKRAGRIDDLLHMANLAQRRNEWIESLPREEQGRLSLARALVHDPPVLLLDEPAARLGSQARIALREQLLTLRERGKTVLFSSPVLGDLTEVCAAVAVLDAARLVAWGTPDEIRAAVRRRQATRRVRIILTADPEAAISLLRSLPDVLGVTWPEGRSPIPHVAGEDETSGRGPAGRACELEVDFLGDDLAQTAVLTRLLEAGMRVIGFREVQGEWADVWLRISAGEGS